MVIRVDTEGHDAVVMHDLFNALDIVNLFNYSLPRLRTLITNDTVTSSSSTADDVPSCDFPPLLLFWEQNKLSKSEYASLNDALHRRGYMTHEDYFVGRWRSQDMYAVLSPHSSQYLERCEQVPYEEGVFL
eukprot:gene38508-46809_t